MKRVEHLLVILMEECAEVAQRASKALRFGLLEKEPGQELTNSARLSGEIDDLWAAVEMLRAEGAMRSLLSGRIRDKREKVERFLTYSAECGTLAGEFYCPWCGIRPTATPHVWWALDDEEGIQEGRSEQEALCQHCRKPIILRRTVTVDFVASRPAGKREGGQP